MSLRVATGQHSNYGTIDIAARKVDGINEEASNTRNRLEGETKLDEGEREGRRQIGVFSATFIIFNRIIGAGCVTASSVSLTSPHHLFALAYSRRLQLS